MIEGERLNQLWQSAQESIEEISGRLNTGNEKSMDVVGLARLYEAGVKLSECRARLFGLNPPTKTLNEQWTFSMRREERKIVVSFDASPLEGPLAPVEGLTMYSKGKCIYNGGELRESGANSQPSCQLPSGVTSSQLPPTPESGEYCEVRQSRWDMSAALPAGSITVERLPDAAETVAGAFGKTEPLKEPVEVAVVDKSATTPAAYLASGVKFGWGPPVE